MEDSESNAVCSAKKYFESFPKDFRNRYHFLPKLRAKHIKKRGKNRGKLDFPWIVTQLHNSSYYNMGLCSLCIELALSDAEANDLLKISIRNSYSFSPNSRTFAYEFYAQKCNLLGITRDPNFPDW
jgi:hypothetical protein